MGFARRSISAIVSAIVLVAAGCSAIATSVDYDARADFSRFRTFALHVPAPGRAPRAQKRIEEVITATLEAKGLSRSTGGTGDLRVYTHVIVEQRQEVDTLLYGYAPRRPGGLAIVTSRYIPVGTLFVDLVDTENHELVWRGKATGVIDPDREVREKQLRAAVKKMFERYPTRAFSAAARRPSVS